MKMMKAMIGAAAAGAALLGATARADDGPTFSGNVALATDYMFRGVSQTGNNVALQGGFDYANGMIYAGTWGSNVEFGFGEDQLELDFYAGIKPAVGPLTLDVGVIGYFYPGASDDAAELDYVEGKLGASFAPTETVSLGAAAFYSPEFTGETGAGLYLEANASMTLSDSFGVSGAVGQQTIDDVNGPGVASTVEDDYITYNIGAYHSAFGFTLDLRYIGSTIEKADPIVTSAFTTEDRTADRVVFTVKRAM